MMKAASTNSSREPECGFAHLPQDALIGIYTFLPSYSLRAAAATNKCWSHALRQAPLPVRQRAAWRHRWTRVGAGASLQHPDSCVCTCDGTWSPGGVVLSTTLRLSLGRDAGFRLVVEDVAPGDLLMGITLHRPDDDEGLRVRHQRLIDTGYHYIMGRHLEADGDIQLSPHPAGDACRVATRSIFYGGRSRRCVFATPTENSCGLAIDAGADGRSPDRLAKLRRVGDWVEFALVGGVLRATDYTGKAFVWGTRVEEGEIWVPTLAWTGSRASIRLAPPML